MGSAASSNLMDEIWRLRFQEDWSKERISRHLGVHRNTVMKWVGRHPSEKPAEKPHAARRLDINVLLAMYRDEGLTVRQIAERVGSKQPYITVLLNRHPDWPSTRRWTPPTAGRSTRLAPVDLHKLPAKVLYRGSYWLLDAALRSSKISKREFQKRISEDWPERLWWISREEADAQIVTYDGKIMALVEAARKAGLSVDIVRNRQRKGWPSEHWFAPPHTQYTGEGIRKSLSSLARSNGVSSSTLWYRIRAGVPEDPWFDTNEVLRDFKRGQRVAARELRAEEQNRAVIARKARLKKS